MKLQFLQQICLNNSPWISHVNWEAEAIGNPNGGNELIAFQDVAFMFY